jgi:hypothetical protein
MVNSVALQISTETNKGHVYSKHKIMILRPKIPQQCLQAEGHSKLKASNNREACS